MENTSEYKQRDEIIIDADTGNKQRTYEWIPLDKVPFSQHKVLDHFRNVVQGRAPNQPLSMTLGYRYIEVEEGHVVLSLTSAEHLMHGAGNMHGGVLATLIDTAAIGAILTTIPKGGRAPTVQMSVQYLKSVVGEGIELRAEGKLVHRGRQLATSEGVVRDLEGTIYATGTIVSMIKEP